MGYENAYEYEGGKEDWIEAGYPVERGPLNPQDAPR
jgi:rhodanese-related sulfurtransferase